MNLFPFVLLWVLAISGCRSINDCATEEAAVLRGGADCRLQQRTTFMVKPNAYLSWFSIATELNVSFTDEKGESPTQMIFRLWEAQVVNGQLSCKHDEYSFDPLPSEHCRFASTCQVSVKTTSCLSIQRFNRKDTTGRLVVNILAPSFSVKLVDVRIVLATIWPFGCACLFLSDSARNFMRNERTQTFVVASLPWWLLSESTVYIILKISLAFPWRSIAFVAIANCIAYSYCNLVGRDFRFTVNVLAHCNRQWVLSRNNFVFTVGVVACLSLVDYYNTLADRWALYREVGPTDVFCTRLTLSVAAAIIFYFRYTITSMLLELSHT